MFNKNFSKKLKFSLLHSFHFTFINIECLIGHLQIFRSKCFIIHANKNFELNVIKIVLFEN